MRQRWPDLTTFNRPALDLFNEFERLVSAETASPIRQTLTTEGFRPLVDVSERDTAFLVSVDVPGMKSEDIKIEVHGDTLVVSGERHKEERSEVNGARYYERQFGSFSRSFTLPKSVDADNIEANYHDGVLELLVPKKEISKAKTIEIKKEKASFFDRLIGSASSEKSDKH
jgi:HSP20 family protein